MYNCNTVMLVIMSYLSIFSYRSYLLVNNVIFALHHPSHFLDYHNTASSIHCFAIALVTRQYVLYQEVSAQLWLGRGPGPLYLYIWQIYQEICRPMLIQSFAERLIYTNKTIFRGVEIQFTLRGKCIHLTLGFNHSWAPLNENLAGEKR